MLSIPLWSDFIEKMEELELKEKEAFFQSHYGLILSYAKPISALVAALKTFQSHYGLILSI